jgi:hypothetical protein
MRDGTDLRVPGLEVGLLRKRSTFLTNSKRVDNSQSPLVLRNSPYLWERIWSLVSSRSLKALELEHDLIPSDLQHRQQNHICIFLI